GSKSITNRALLIAALADGTSTLRNVLFSDDTEFMIGALRELGIDLDVDRGRNEVVVHGKGGEIGVPAGPIYVGNSGTCARFLTTAVALGHGDYVIDGNERMRQRPIQDLVDGLVELGVDVTTVDGTGCPPLTVHASGLRGGETSVSGSTSSQYLSSILLSAPYAASPVRIRVEGKLVSRPYVAMSARMMEQFGARVTWKGDDEIAVSTDEKYKGRDYAIESDYSSASYFAGAAALAGGRVVLTRLPADSLQGDAAFLEIIGRMGARVEQRDNAVDVTGTGKLAGIDADLFDCSDLVPTVAVLGAFASGKTRIRNVENIRVKESDRIASVTAELRRIGARVEEFKEGLEVEGGGALHGASIKTYDDHRIAMAFSLAGLKVKGIKIEDPGCVAKTYPRFFEELGALTR
ncbi:MAG: 3-phosphoshikimate 1-carboxyvinyltransferase, partial [Candidatus Lokiarchaeota archaeon]|nr:3-phosphoshikimate 1-carboxyvinyltransferase [Candidatus Lokiarchaeota archaeon]